MAKPLRVLVVEDSEDDTKLLLRELRHGGYDPTFERVDTSEALDKALEKSFEEGWDIVIADYMMPAFNGLAALQSLKAKGIDLPFILVTGQIGEEAAVEAMKAGAGDYISKGNMARLVPAIERELREAQVRRERKEAEAKLKQVAEKYETILRTAMDGFWIADEQGHLLEVNDAYCRMVGYSRDELLSMRIQDVEAAETPEEVQEHIRLLMETGSDRFETRHRRKNGMIVDLEVSVNYLAGDPGRLFAFLRDITERKATEKALRESEERFRLVVANSPDIIFLQDRDLRYTWISNPAAPLTPEQVLGKTDFDLLPHEEAQQLTEIKKKILETGERTSLEIWLSPGGIRRCYEAVYEPIRDGQISGLASYSRDVTERKRTVEALSQSEERLRLAQQVASVGTFEWNIQTGVNRWTPELEAIYGLPPGGFAGTQLAWEKLVYAEDRPDAVRTVESALETDSPVEGEWRVVWPDGTMRWLVGRFQGFKDEAGNPLRLIGVNIDITERKRAEAERERLLREVEQQAAERARYLARLNTLLSVSSSILSETTLQGLSQAVADGARRLVSARFAVTGHSYEQGSFRIGATSQATGTVSCPGEEVKVERGGVYIDLFEKQKSIRLTDHEMRSHTDWWGLPPYHQPLRGLLGARLTGRDGQVAGLLMVTDKEQGEFTPQDEALLRQLAALASLGLQHVEAREERERTLDEMKKVNQQLFISSARQQELAETAQQRTAELQAVLDNMVDAVYVCDREGRVTLVNNAGLQLGGAERPEEVSGRAFQELVEGFKVRHTDGTPMSMEELPQIRALSGETVVLHDEIMLNLRTGRDVYIRVSAAPLRDEFGTLIGSVAVARDVSDLVEIERLKDQFIEVAAHELKTPVTGIRGFAQFLLQREHEGLSPQGIKVLQAINRQAGRITELINDLLDISRLQMGQLELSMEKIDLAGLVEEVVDRVALTTSKHQIQTVKSEPVVVQGDRGRLEQVLFNLLDNAVRYSPQGGPSQGRIEVSVGIGDHHAVVSVRDHGIGIPEEKQARIFQRFYRAHTGTPYDYGGMGVGLYISSEIVKRHGGRMWFESEEGKGSTFYFILPVERPLA